MAFFYRDGRLKLGTETEFIDIEEKARSLDGPSYFYDLDEIETRFRALESALGSSNHCIHYAMKANSHKAVLNRLAKLGAGADTVSGGEIRRALEGGFHPSKIIFSGVAKTVKEIEFAIQSGIKQINVESPQELERILSVAQRLDRVADVAFRMNPDVSPQTHPYITTGFRENKFGMDESFLPELKQTLERGGKHLRLRGLTMHIGSQIFELDVLQEAVEKIVAVHKQLAAELKSQGHPLDRLDVGGGIGINYDTDDATAEFTMMKQYGEMLRKTVADLNVEILAEPGRILVARAGLLVGEVQYIKRAPAKTFAILDTGMHHLIRPALYSAKHRVLAIHKSGSSKQVYDVVGPICESSDFLAKNVELPELSQGQLLGLADSGAYGFSMASQYNSHDLPTELAYSRGKQVES